MNSRDSLSTLSVVAVAFGMLFALAIPVYGQGVPADSSQQAASALNEVLQHNIEDWILQGRGIPEDWSHHYLVFSNPGAEEEAIAHGTHDRWLSIVNDPRYILQQMKRDPAARKKAEESVAAPQTMEAQDSPAAERAARVEPPAKAQKSKITKDWSTGLGGLAATLTGTVGSLNSSSISGSSTLNVDGTTLTASAPTAASATGTFTGNPANGQTVTIGGSVTLTASLSTAATATITIGSSFCIGPGQGVDVDGTTLTTNATAGTGTFVVGTVPSAGEQVTIGGVIYSFETTLSGSTANQVLVPGTNSSSNRTATAENLSVAINNSGTCGLTSNGVCTLNVSAANPEVSSTDSSSSSQTMTSRCADNAAITGTSSTHVTVNTVAAASSAGSNSATTFALNTSGSTTTPASQSLTASNIESAINTNSTTKALVTATNPSTGEVLLTANTWGTGANSYSLSDTATSGVTLVGFAGGLNGTNTGMYFAIDNVLADAATNLAAAIARNGAAVGVTASSAGAVVTATATTPGTGGDGIAIAEGLNNFSWATSTLGSASDGTNSSTTFAYWSVNTYISPAQVATNIANAINSNTTLQSVVSAGANAPASGDVTFLAVTTGTAANGEAVTPGSFSAFTGGTLSAGTATPNGSVQPNAYPAKFSFSTSSANCNSDFVVYPTGTAVAATSASIAAYDNLYVSGCSGTVPSVFWSYSTGGTVTTSPIISFDSTGSQLAFIQVASSKASLVLLKWAASTSGALTTQASGSAYRSCTAPCMYTMALAGSTTPDDTFSAPYYDYGNDIVYVGDDSGNLHKFTGVFNGTPAENTTSPWPVNLSTSKLASPVYDPTWNGGQIFVGDLGGVLHCVTASTGAIFGTSNNLGGAIADAPLINGSANYVIAFVSSDAVYGFSEQFFPGGEGGPVSVGSGGSEYYLYAGTFDNVYYQSSNSTGNIYVVGNTGVKTGATLYQVALSGGFLTGGVSGVVTGLTPNATDAYPWPSPVSEFCNPGSASNCALNAGGTATTTGTDYVFFSVNRGAKTGCTNTAGNGCILSYNVSNPSSVAISGSGLNVTTPTTNGCWATGGIVIDNSVQSGTLAGASEIYAVNLNGNASAATGTGCSGTVASAIIDGVQASQSSP